MSDERKQIYLSYLNMLKDKLCLKDWIIEVKDDPPSSCYMVSIYTVDGQKKASLYLSEQFLKETAEEQRQTCLHELIHLHFTQCAKIAQRKMNDKDYDIWNLMFEYGIDGIADAIAPLFPLRNV